MTIAASSTMIHSADVQHLFQGGTTNTTTNLQEELNCTLVKYDPSKSYKQNTLDIMRQFVVACEEEDEEEAFFVVDLSHVARQVLRWNDHLPMVQMRYAVKCNPNPTMLKLLEHMGAGFDCASKEEIKAIIEMKSPRFVDTATGKFDPKRIIFAQPCKQISHMKYAREVGVQYTTLDNEQELIKLKKYWPEAKCVIRIATDDSNSICQFSSKFGASLDRAKRIIESASKHDMCLVGVSFHVGSGCQDSESFVKAIANARKVFDMAAEHGIRMTLLDIGGGFPGFRQGSNSNALQKVVPFETTCASIRMALDEYFSFDSGIEFIGEPGRYIATGSHHLAINVFAKRECNQTMSHVSSPLALSKEGSDIVVPGDDAFLYYVNDGIYQSFNNIYFDHYVPKLNVLRQSPSDSEEAKLWPSTVFGPTCDSIDVLGKHMMLPELHIGDWLAVTNFGAYTVSSASAGFNGFKTEKMIYVWRN